MELARKRGQLRKHFLADFLINFYFISEIQILAKNKNSLKKLRIKRNGNISNISFCPKLIFEVVLTENIQVETFLQLALFVFLLNAWERPQGY